MPSFRRFLSFFLYLTSTFWLILYTEHLLLFLKYSTVLFATLSSESSACFLVFERSFLNLMKSFFVGFETFLISGEPRFSDKPKRTNSLLFLPKLTAKRDYQRSSLRCFVIYAFHVILEIFYSEFLPFFLGPRIVCSRLDHSNIFHSAESLHRTFEFAPLSD